MKTPKQLYDYESKRAKEYELELHQTLNDLDIPVIKKFRLITLFEWYGNARAIKSKAYQELKNDKL